MTDWAHEEFEQAATRLLQRLSAYVRDSAAGDGPVVRLRPVADIAGDLRLGHWIRTGGLTATTFDTFVTGYLENSTHLHHPGFLAHQVAVPDFPATLADFMNGVMNNGMAIYEMGPAAVAVELTVLDWMLDKLGWPVSRWPGDAAETPHGGGVLTHGGSLANLTALLAARARIAPTAWEEGVAGDLGVLVPPTSHYSVARAVSILGMGHRAIEPLEVDRREVIRVAGLPGALRRLCDAGRRPMALVANACSTATGLYDPLDEIAAFCQENHIWLHVDAAHGASALLSGRDRHLLDGIERADSVVWDAHKMLRTSGLCAAVLFRDECDLREAFRQQASYLFYGDGDQGVDLIHRTIECTKLPLGLKLFLNLAWKGEVGLATYWERQTDTARRFAAILRQRDGFECLVEPVANIVCFRHGTGNEGQIALRERLLAGGRFHVSSAEVCGKRYLRLVIMSPATDDETLVALLDEIERLAPPG